MSNGAYSLIVDGKPISLRRSENVRLVTPARDEHPATVASRLAKSTRLAIDSNQAADFLVVWGDPQKLKEIQTYRDVQNTRAGFHDPEGNLLLLTNDVLISFVDGVSDSERERLLRGVNGRIIERNKEFWKVRVSDPNPDAPLILANQLAKESIVKYAEPNALQAAVFQQLPQNEPRFGNQWTLRNTGQGGGTMGADVNALGAWAISTGAPSIAIVVHDSGVDITHPDLYANLNPGWDFDNGDADARNNTGPHGTACAGIIGATLNRQGVTGIAPNCRIVPLRAAGSHTWQTWAATFDWAAQRGRIISCSWTITPNNTLSEAIRRAISNGVVVFCAAGNGGTNSISYPASMPETIAVGASTNRDVRANYSQFGNGLDFVAPSNGGTLAVETTDVQGPDGYNTAQGPQLVIGNFGYSAGGWRVENHPRFLADLTGDGRADVVGFGDNGVWVALNNGNGTFQAPQLAIGNFGYSAGGWRVQNHPRFPADLTGDGRADIVGFGDNGVWVALNNGNGTFQAPQLVLGNFGYNAGGWRVENHPRFLADLTGDRRADIVGFGDNGVWVALNNGNGTFQAPQLVLGNFGYSAGGWRVQNHPRFLADLTGDGRADIVGFGDNGVWVALNNGNGTFQAPQLVVGNFGYNAGGWRVENHPRFLADLTGDGRADIVGFGDNGVWVALNNGNGTFQAPQLVLGNFGYNAGGWRVQNHPRFLADLTGDGRADIVGFGDNGVWVALNNGNGTFQTPQLVLGNFGYNAGGWRVQNHPRFLADLNGDGRADIVGFGNDGVWVALNNGNGTFQAPQLVVGNFGYNAGGWRVENHPRFLADLNGDGRADIVGFGDNGVWFARGIGDGTFDSPGNYCNANDATGFGGTSAATPLAAGVAGLMLSVNPGLTPQAVRQIMRGTAVKIDPANGNYDANGWSNQYGFGRVNAALAVQRARPPQLVIGNFGYNAGGWRVENHPRFLADLTGDRRADIVGFGDNGVWVALNNGNATFQAPQLVIGNFGYNAGGWRVQNHPRFPADLTGDGRADIVGFGDNGVWVALNNGNGTFQAPQLVLGNFGYNAGGWRVENHPRFLADLTGDGRADIVGFGDNGVWVALNNGNGTFQAPQLVVLNFGYSAGGWRVQNHPRFLADLTGDGRADIVGFGDNGVWVALNNGNGTFQTPQLVVGNFGYNAGGWRVENHPRFLADLNGDGRADIVGFGNDGVWVALNNGNGTFQAPQLMVGNFGYNAGGWRVEKHPRFLGDLNGDGRADIVGFGDNGVWVQTV